MKKNKIGNVLFLGIGAALSAILFLLMLAPGVKETLLDTTASCYKLINFGDSARVGLIIALILDITTLALSVCLLMVNLLKTKIKYEKSVALIAAAAAIVSAVLHFLSKQLIGAGDSGIITLGVGAIFCGIVLIVAAVCFLFYALSKK